MADVPRLFYCLWQEEPIREKLFELLSKKDICAIRTANSACCNLVTKRLFLRTHLGFTANSFTKPGRIQALSRIGHHIEHLTFHFAHSDATFLPPLIHPQSGREISFLYTPHISMASVLARPKYANTELGEILTQQYPALFHAASNVPSFINAMKNMPNIRHLTIKTPGQDPKERYRRDIVDYALISLRISVERATLTRLTKLSLSGVHPSAFNYLRHNPAFGASPSAARRWRQIRKLNIAVESWDFYGPSPGLDHLKIIDDYIRGFSSNLEKFTFAWLGRKGPCPLALAGDPLFAPARCTRKLFHEVTGPMSPLPARPERRPLVMPCLRYMQVRNATMNAPQLSTLVASHKATVREFDFENVVLINGGTWDEALAPLHDATSDGGDLWSRHSIGESESSLLAPQPSLGSGTVSSREDELTVDSSAAAAAASKELFEVDLDGVEFGGINDIDAGATEADVAEWARGVTAAGTPVDMAPESVEEEQDGDGGLASDIEAARKASLAFSTKLTKQRIRKKRSRKHHHRKGSFHTATDDEEDRRSQARSDCRSETRSNHSRHFNDSSSHTQSRHRHTRSDELPEKDRSIRRSSSSWWHRGHRQHRSEELPEIPAMPEVIGTDDESYFRPKPPQPMMDISAPILSPDPLPVLLQPTIYDPSAKTGAVLGISATGSEDGLSSVQRSIEAELLAEAEEAAARMSALKRAKEAVLAKLGREFCRRKASSSHSKDSAAVIAGLSTLNLGMNLQLGNGLNSCGSMGLRIREGLFGRSVVNVASVAIAPDHRSLESQSALVPLMFSRA